MSEENVSVHPREAKRASSLLSEGVKTVPASINYVASSALNYCHHRVMKC